MFDVDEERIPLDEVPRHIRTPRPVHKATPWRWALTGVGNPRVKLETEKIGGKRYTTAAAIARFVAALSRAAGDGPAASTHRQADVRRAEDELNAEGIK